MVIKLIKSATKSAGKGMKDGIKNDPEVRKAMDRFPRTFSFIKKRFSPDEKFGLLLTTGVVISGIFLYLFFVVLHGLFTQDLLVMSDLRVLNIIKAFRSQKPSEFWLLLTVLGNKEIIIAGTLLAGVFIILLKRWRYLVVLTTSVVFGEIFVWMVKNTVDRKRPPLSISVLPADGYSFPSGHAFMAMALYGILGYFVYRAAKSKTNKILVVIVFLALIVAIGFSRLYFGVHWPSDVLASFAAGAAWVTVLVTVLEIRRKFRSSGKKILNFDFFQIRAIGLGLLFFWIIIAGFDWRKNLNEFSDKFVVNEQKWQNNITVNQEDIPEKLFLGLPRVSETISGKSQEPIHIVVLGHESSLEDAFKKAGWIKCDKLNTRNLKRLIVATFTGKPYPAAPGVPSLWNTFPNDLAFEKPTKTNSVNERSHIHFWATPYLFEGKIPVWFGTAHFDTTIKGGSIMVLPIHTIDPAIDKERDEIKKELVNTGKIGKTEEFQVVDPTLGKNQAGDLFFTDGKALIFYLKSQ